MVIYAKKSNKQWIWIAQCRRTRQVVAFHIRGRARVDAKELWKKIPLVIKKNGYFYSDDWDAYKGVFQSKDIFHQNKKEILIIWNGSTILSGREFPDWLVSRFHLPNF